MARPRKPIDPKNVEAYAALGFTMEEIAVLSDCSVDTLERRFADAIKKGRLKDKVSYLRAVRHEALGEPIPIVKDGVVMMGPQRRPHLGFCALYAKLKGWYVERVETVAEITNHDKLWVAEWGGKQEQADDDK